MTLDDTCHGHRFIDSQGAALTLFANVRRVRRSARVEGANTDFTSFLEVLRGRAEEARYLSASTEETEHAAEESKG